MVPGEKRTETKKRIQYYITILFDEWQQQSLTLDQMVNLFDEKHGIKIKKPSVNEYLIKMRKHIKFNITKVNVKFNAYQIQSGEKLDIELVWPSKVKEAHTRPKSVDDYYVKFNPPRSALINKLLGFAA